jgi:hypothetical protein
MKGRIALFLYQPYCSVQSGNGVIQALEPDYRFKIFSRQRVEQDFFDDVDCVCIPGGLGDASSYDFLMRENAGRIRDFVDGGGRYLGICMGAYWAGPDYLDILTQLHADQYIRRPRTDTHRPHAKALDVTWQGEQERMFFYDGCSIYGKGQFETVATYANGDNMAGYQGRIGMIGCHPESELHWYQSYKYMLPHWHHRRHHQLLLDFANELMLK